MVHLKEDALKLLFAITAGLALVTTTPVLAQTQAPPAATAAAKHYTTGATTIGTLLADPAAKAIIDKHIPGFSDNPQISMVSGATLLQLQPMKPDVLSDANLAAIDAEFAGLPAK